MTPLPKRLARLSRQDRSHVEQTQMLKLQSLLQVVLQSNPFWQQKYADLPFEPLSVSTLQGFREFPTVTKAELAADQAAHPPYGSNLTYEPAAYVRLHQTSGTTGHPMRWLDTSESWNAMLDAWADIYALAGVDESDRIAFPFSFGPFLGFWAAFDGAARIGCLCLPGGGLSSEARLKQIVELEATVVLCTPTYALRLAEVAAEQQIDLASSSVRTLIVAGEPGGCIPATCERIESAWGARLIDHWGMTEVGPLAVEPEDRPGGLTILERHCIAEVVDPDTLEAVPAGTTGELLITTLDRIGTPLIRYRTGDLVCVDPEPHASGRALMHLAGGILGRADDMVIIRGNNVFPSSVEAVLRGFDEVAEFQIVVHTRREMKHMTLRIEPAPSADPVALAERVRRAIKTELNFHADVETVEPGDLPRFELKGRRLVRENA